MPASCFAKVVGKQVVRMVAAGTLVSEADLGS